MKQQLRETLDNNSFIDKGHRKSTKKCKPELERSSTKTTLREEQSPAKC